MSTVTTVRLARGFVAEVRGVDLSADIDAELANELRALIADNRVLVFKNQKLGPEDQIRLMRVFGNVLDEMHDGTWHSYVSTEKGSSVLPGRLLFHSDNHMTNEPLQFLSLYAAEVDRESAPTLYVDNVGAYRRMPAELRGTLDEIQTQQVSYYFYGQGGDRPSRSVTPDHEDAPRADHPAVWRHPVSGEPFVYITELHTHHVLGMPLERSDAFLEQVREVLYESDEMYEHHWAKGDLVIWDNRATQHARGPVPDAQLDPDAGPRSLRRVIVGTKDYEQQMQERAAGAAAMM